MRYVLRLAVVAVAASGCLEPEEPVASYFRAPAPATLPPLDPASTEAAARVDAVGRKVLAANPEIGARPLFRTIGAPKPEVFHRGTADVFITEGLVKQCATEGQLAAVLAVELGKMVREREAAAPAQVRRPQPPPPIDSRLGNDDQFGGTPDRTDLKELVDADIERRKRRRPNDADYDAERRHQRAAASPLPDPNVLAVAYLQKAGFGPSDHSAATALLDGAASNAEFERQITGPTASSTAPPSRESGPASP